MKNILILTILCCAVSAVRGQLFDTSAAQVETVTRLMGTGRVFSATVTVSRQKGKKQVKIAENRIAVNGDNLRVEHKPLLEPSLAKQTERLKQAGVDTVITLLLSKPNKAYMIFPAKKAYIEAIVESPDAKAKPAHTESKFLRMETVDGHPCAVREMTIVNADESRQVITIWEATDLKNFILKSQMDHGDDSMEVLHFTNINTEKPDDTLFTLPAAYRKLGNGAAGEIVQMMMDFDLDRDAALAETLR